MNQHTSIFLDSGAFSAWNKGIEVDINAYLEFCLENLPYVDYIANLDVIPGRPGRPTTPTEREMSAKKGWENYFYLLDNGIPEDKLIHIFHQDEDFKWLRRMVNHMRFVIGLSPANDRTTKQKIKWLDECMNYVCNSIGTPVIKFHGFAVTSVEIMTRFPWYSVDSTSWVLYGRYGMVLVPKIYSDGRVNYLQTERVFVSEKSPKTAMDGKHFDSYPLMQKERISTYFANHGYTIPQLSTDHRARDEVNLIYYLELEKSLPEWPWQYKRKGIPILGAL